ncbi:calcium-transporting ATPase [Legionella sainthelensi]|uniref:Calcium-transporting ATPase n=1 Tax=Legionella sainthelensi TaxID=28087 RepID=A0A0W0YVN6_9GAMM|nr:calcium ABC transporter ATPase [Legionella sainthelensi]KTD60582.1 calcium-transporting ATPase [Legionella sainthelensi]VEH31019.1 calcium-transporting ATPase [Legionella sainthelensi]
MKKLKSTSQNPQETNPKGNRALPLQLVQNIEPDRTFYLRSTVEGIGNFFSTRVKELYHTLAMTFSLDSMDWSSFKKYIWPTISSGAALVLGHYLTQNLSEYQMGSPEYDFIYKFLFGAAILGYCALNRITDKKFTSQAELSLAVASEVMAITYMYSSVFKGTTFLLNNTVSDEYSLIASLGTSALVVPSGISFLAQKAQEFLIRFQYSRGAQRSDTALISGGLTPISNLYFQINHFIANELMVSSRTFQLGLISHNIRHADKIIQKFRNLPALLADLAPSTLKKMSVQQEKLDHDYEYNHKLHQVLKFTSNGSMFVSVPRYQLRTGDLVYCDNSIDLACVPVSGELVALKQDGKGNFTQVVEEKKFSVNLKAQNGEDVWIEHQTKPNFTSNYKKIDLYAVREGKQAGVLVGDKLNLYGNDNIFIQIKPEKELLLSSNYEKKSVINEVIAERKQRSVLYSILGSIIMAAFLQRDITLMPAETIKLMFTLFQTMIPFSEAFLRETVNSRLMKALNSNLGDQPLETIDALRVVDLCNALGGYYHDRFPNGVAVISDKTGTLTTTGMDVLGLWTTDMAPDVQQILKEKDGLLLPQEAQWLKSLEVFCEAYTNNKKELEPEEHAILDLFESLLNNQQCLDVTTYGTNHFKKVLTIKDKKKEMETFHLGLYRTFGGRLTLVKEGNEYFLVFCGVPNQDSFKETPVLQAYTMMQSRTEVLSRDWCIARSKLHGDEFIALRELMDKDDKEQIEHFILKRPALLKNMMYYGTFIIDNPIKKGAEKFIAQCREVSIPVFVATGDTAKAAENIAKVLCPKNAKKILTIRAKQVKENPLEFLTAENYPADSTVIFSGVNEAILARFQKLMDREPTKRPVIIFAEMSTEGKGILARYLKDHHYFVVANGDGTNDVMMMKNSNMVIAHHSDDGAFAPGVDSLSNISEEQLRRLFGSQKTFYELFDINLPKSLFVQQFAPLANSQEKPTMALALKSGKMTFDLAKTVGAHVTEMNQQHWYSVVFDLLWLWISFYEINESADLPMDNRNINASRLISNTMAIALTIAVFQSLANYALFNESTNLTSMLIMLSLLPLVLKSIFSGFKMVQESVYPPLETTEVEKKDETSSNRSSVLSYLGSFFSHKPVRQLEAVSSIPQPD